MDLLEKNSKQMLKTRVKYTVLNPITIKALIVNMQFNWLYFSIVASTWHFAVSRNTLKRLPVVDYDYAVTIIIKINGSEGIPFFVTGAFMWLSVLCVLCLMTLRDMPVKVLNNENKLSLRVLLVQD